MRLDIEQFIEPYKDRLTTKKIILCKDALKRAGELKEVLPEGKWLLVADPTTYEIAGEQVEKVLHDSGTHIQKIILPLNDGRVVADDETIEFLSREILHASPSALIAVGAGAINDSVKAASHKAKLPYAVVATSPSMTGYTSALAAILAHRVKTTQVCTPPVALIGDLDILAGSPYRMIVSGLGDLISRSVSVADWTLSHHLNGTEYAKDSLALVSVSEKLLEGVAPKLKDRDVEAVGKLMASLCLMGFSMSLAGTSAPASGGEHLISHYIDMHHFAFGKPHDFHGCQVGVGTIATAALYEKLLALDMGSLPEGLHVEYPDWSEVQQEVHGHFGKIADDVLVHAKSAHPSPEELQERLSMLKEKWLVLKSDLQKVLRPASEIKQELLDVGAPTSFADLGVSDEHKKNAMLYSRYIRDRYTILDLLAELGYLEKWTNEVIEEHQL